MLAKKWLLVGVLALLSLNLAMAQDPYEHPATGEPLLITCYRGTPTAIDGDLSDWTLEAMTPAVLDVEEQLYTGEGSWDDAGDCSGIFYVLWDDEYVYMGVEVKDDKLSMNKTDGDIWNADCVEVFFATTNAVSDHSEHYQFGLNANGQTWNWCNMDSDGQSAIDYLQVAVSETDDGYILEAALEHGQLLSLDFSVGSVIGFHPVIDDTDDSDREIQITWTGLEAHDQSQGYGQIVLSGEEAIPAELSRYPSPEDGATDMPLDTTLSWTGGAYAVAHDLYMGTSFDDVNDGTTPTSAAQSATTYDPGLLEYGQTYYWRVDEVNGAPDNTVFKGAVWSFSTEPIGYPIAGVVATSNGIPMEGADPAQMVDGSGLNYNDEHSLDAADMWLCTQDGEDSLWIQYEFDTLYKLHEMLVWNYNSQFEMILGFGLKDVTVEYSENGADWTVLGDVVLNQATALPDYTANTAVAFDGITAKYVRLAVNSGWGTVGQYGLSEVRFLSIPVQAREPDPADGAIDVDLNTALTWRIGRGAIAHEVSFGTDPAALASVATPADTSYSPGLLDLNTTYHWMVTESLETEAWDGSVWSFTTQEYLVVDDFESYDNEENAIYDTWIDGWINGTGSTVGHLTEPFAETTIVNGGRQAMPLFYENSGVDTSEADLDLNQDWTASGIGTLALYVYGDAANSGGQLYVAINGTKIAADGAVDLASETWQLCEIDLSAAGNVSNVTSLTIGVEGSGAEGVVYIDDIRLYP